MKWCTDWQQIFASLCKRSIYPDFLEKNMKHSRMKLFDENHSSLPW